MISGRWLLVLLGLAAFAYFLAEDKKAARAHPTAELADLNFLLALSNRLNPQTVPRSAKLSQEVLRNLPWATADIEGLPKDERRRQIEHVVDNVFRDAWAQQLTNECAASSTRLVALV